MLTNPLIDRTNRFYIEISKKVLSEKEHDILQKLLIEKKTLTEVGDNYGINGESVRRMYERTFEKVKSVTEVLADIDFYKYKNVLPSIVIYYSDVILRELERPKDPHPGRGGACGQATRRGSTARGLAGGLAARMAW